MVTPKEKLTIAILTDGFFPFTIGGIQKHSYYLIKYWAKQGVVVHIYHPYHYPSEAIKKYFSPEELAQIQFIFVEHPQSLKFPGHYIFNSYRYSKSLYHAVIQKTYDAIYTQGLTGWYLLKKQAQYPKIISNLHGLNMFQRCINLKDKLQLKALQIPARKIIQNSAKQISLGGKLTKLHYQHGAREGTVYEVPNAISPEWLEEKGIPDSVHKPVSVNNQPKRFIFIGRYERLKGIEEIHSVLQQLVGNSDQLTRNKGTENKANVEGKKKKGDFETAFEFHFIGPIPMNKQLPQLIKSSLTQIVYHGSIRDQEQIKSLLRSSDVLVCPSYSEGMPTVILEAMACSCAIIATDVGASGELVDASNGWLIKGNIESGLIKAMLEAIRIDADSLQKMKESSLQKVKEKYTWDVVARKTLEVMRK